MTTPIQKWKDAHVGISVPDDALATMAPFPSLYANDFITFLQSRGDDPKVMEFVRDIHREMVWVYDNWAKSQRDGNPGALIVDLLNAAKGGSEYEFTARFLRDYAKANGINIEMADGRAPDWFSDLQAAQ